jgi:predicted Rossmann-fold nucleotide-binding protein
MPGFNLPFQPIRQSLYNRVDLYARFDPAKAESLVKTADFRIFKHFLQTGGPTPADPYMGMMQALHDNAITQGIYKLIGRRQVAAVAGDHKMRRDASVYRDIALLARRLSQNGILMCTGGGSGAMEATHLGALLAKHALKDLDQAIARLQTKPELPDLRGIVSQGGKVNKALVVQAHAWFTPAYEIAAEIKHPGTSLGLPTWGYGHEPATPFATHIGKYFQNSIREEGLLALAKQGVVYAPGTAGTIQEIFQDGAQNYYRTFGYFSPMVMFGVEYWTTTYPVVGVLEKLFPEEFGKLLLVTDDVAEAAAFIEKFRP